ncbi:MAG: DUF4832 domain-containing protein [Rhodopirellula sp. JB055]|uniref:DUF4832 domain-containing protein n=1 Tax=Rhodopirellula sp. JB055 TaxID=3342846 RepID=UPI00370B9392
MIQNPVCPSPSMTKAQPIDSHSILPVRLLRCLLVVCWLSFNALSAHSALGQGPAVPLPLTSDANDIQPMTGVVLWHDHEDVATDAISMEFRYCGYDEVAIGPNRWDFTKVEQILDDIASRSHQAVLRFRFVYPGKTTTVPAFIREAQGYHETVAKSEGKRTHFCDWSSPELQRFTLDFYTEFAKRYDADPRIAFLQTGFGLWSEYHIYDGPMKLGQTFPSMEFQSKFLRHLDQQFNSLPWMISIDAADDEFTPIAGDDSLLALQFGLFDDSFLSKSHSKWNAKNWRAMGRDRWHRTVGGGEFSYYNRRDQKLALAPTGPHGISVEQSCRDFHITFMIGNDQPTYQPIERIREAGVAMGYRFRVTQATVSKTNQGSTVELQVTNDGVAPIYRDAFFALRGKRSEQTLKGLLPGETRSFTIENVSGKVIGKDIEIESDAILPNQAIQFFADLK